MEAAEAGPVVDCDTFLEDHGAYIDDCLDHREAAAHEAHARACESCARYARVLSRGLTIARDFPDIEPSAHFEQRLQHRIFHVDDEARLAHGGSRSLVGIAAMALIALIAWSPVIFRATSQSRTVAEARTGSPSAETADALYSGWYMQGASAEIEQTPVHRLVSYAGSYSPLIVSPPAFARGPRAVRLVSATTQ